MQLNSHLGKGMLLRRPKGGYTLFLTERRNTIRGDRFEVKGNSFVLFDHGAVAIKLELLSKPVGFHKAVRPA